MQEMYRLGLDIGALSATLSTVAVVTVNLPIWIIAVSSIIIASIPSIVKLIIKRKNRSKHNADSEYRDEALDSLLSAGFDEWM